VSNGTVPAELTVATSGDMKEFGRRLARLLRAGDLVLLSGPLGAGKTTLVQGIADGLGVRGPITSPTFVIARVHPSLSGGPDLVHADAYRLASPAEVDDLDLDASLDRSVTVVEWGGGMAEGLAADRLEVTITPARGPGRAGAGPPGGSYPGAGGGVTGGDAADAGEDGPAEPRAVRVAGLGERWEPAGESALLARLTGPEAV
jgi:tRNA threonylcarbamoyladenosine biosynthesis protein TsaE